MNKLALSMIVKNESKYLSRCLQSVSDLVDEMVIVDTGSTDNSKQIALSFGAKVFDFQWNDNFADARNFSLEHSTCDWNLVLDADEYLDKDCIQHLKEFVYKKNVIGRIKLINKFYQDGEIKWSKAFISRILPRGVRYSGRIHEQIVSDYPHLNTSITVFHDGYFLSDKSERNLKLLQLEIKEDPLNDYILYQIAKQYRLKKKYNQADYYFEKGYLVIPRNVHYRPNFIIEYLYNIINVGNLEKGLEVILKERGSLNDYPDFHFVSALLYMELIFKNTSRYAHMLPLIEKEYLTCLELGDSEKNDSVIGTGSYLAAYNLGVFYETNGNLSNAEKYYLKSAEYKYDRAIQRLSNLTK